MFQIAGMTYLDSHSYPFKRDTGKCFGRLSRIIYNFARSTQSLTLIAKILGPILVDKTVFAVLLH